MGFSRVIENDINSAREQKGITKFLNTKFLDLDPSTNLVSAFYKYEVNKFILENSQKNHTSPLISYDENEFNIPDFSIKNILDESKNFATNTQRWKGHVISIKPNNFLAKLFDLNDPSTHEYCLFEKKIISPDDVELLAVGAVFYLSVGFFMEKGQVEKKSLVRFQRLVSWTKEDYDSSIDRAEDLLNTLNWD